jgi:topoisomerase IA-like protein
MLLARGGSSGKLQSLPHPDMKNLIYISRAFVEFGPFSDSELLNFLSRGILREGDHFRHHGLDDWLSLDEWQASTAPSKKPAAKAAKKAPAKKAAKKAVPAKKKA